MLARNVGDIKKLPPLRQRAQGYKENMIYLPGQLGRVDSIRFGGLTKGVVIMSTYEEFMIILNVALLIIAILNLKNK